MKKLPIIILSVSVILLGLFTVMQAHHYPGSFSNNYHEDLTELYFTKPLDMPYILNLNTPYKISFTVSCSCNVTKNYPYAVYFVTDDGKETNVSTGIANLNNGVSANVIETIALSTAPSKYKIGVRLIGADRNISYKVETPAL